MSQRLRAVEPPPSEAIAVALAHLHWSQGDLAAVWGVSQGLVSMILTGRRSITPLVALRLEAALGGSAESWLDLQARHDLAQLRRNESEDLAAIRYRALEIARV